MEHQNELNQQLNQLLVETFHTILKFEEAAIKMTDKIDLSMSEIHLLESIGKQSGRTVSDIAEDLDITLPSVTVAVKKLIKKKYVVKHQNEKDKRSVSLHLTESGERVNRIHSYFHYRLTKAVVNELTDEERRVMLSGIGKLKNFFATKLE